MSDFTLHIEQQLSQLGRDIQDFVSRVVPVQESEADFSPRCDITENDNQYKILLDLPGLGKKDIHIELKEQVLRVSGERLAESAEDGQLHRSEREKGAFSRSFALPENVDASKADARFRNGVLTIAMPKVESEEDIHSIPVT